jgi:hypothetical protein
VAVTPVNGELAAINGGSCARDSLEDDFDGGLTLRGRALKFCGWDRVGFWKVCVERKSGLVRIHFLIPEGSDVSSHEVTHPV